MFALIGWKTIKLVWIWKTDDLCPRKRHKETGRCFGQIREILEGIRQKLNKLKGTAFGVSGGIVESKSFFVKEPNWEGFFLESN